MMQMYKTRIFTCCLHGCETWSLKLREEHRLKVSEKVVMRIFSCKSDKVTAG